MHLTPEEHAHHFSILSQIQGLLKLSQYQSELVRPSATVPLHALQVWLDPEAQPMQLNLVPLGDELKFVALVQFYYLFPFEAKDILTSFIALCNPIMVVGHMGINEDHQVFYRYIYPGPRTAKFHPGILVETLNLFTGQRLILEDTMEKLVNGQIDLFTARDMLQS